MLFASQVMISMAPSGQSVLVLEDTLEMLWSVVLQVSIDIVYTCPRGYIGDALVSCSPGEY